MSRRDWDDDRGRRRRDDYDDYDDYDDRRGRRRDYDDRDYDRGYDDYDRGPRRVRKSGLITALGVVNIVVSSLVLIFGFCLLLGGAVTSDMADFGPFGGPVPEFRSVIRFLSTMALINGIVSIAMAGCGITGGVGLLSRSNWGKVLCLITAGLAVILGILEIVRMVGGVFRLPSFFPARGVAITVVLLNAIMAIGFAVFNAVVLFNSNNTRELK